jgi:hypothetical protein
MKKGIIWRIGDGTNVRIWEDPWIPTGTTRRPRTPRGNTVLSRVSDLIDPYTSTWDAKLVKDIFWAEDVPNILAIPVHVDREDTVAWHFDNNGMFSVKSAYHVLEDEVQHIMSCKRVNHLMLRVTVEACFGRGSGASLDLPRLSCCCGGLPIIVWLSS